MNLKPRYIWPALLGVSLLALVVAIALTGPPPTSVATTTASPVAGVPSAAAPGSPGASAKPSGIGGTPIGDDTPTPQPTPLGHKLAEPRSAEPEDLTGYIWPLKNAWITSRFAPRDFGGFVIIDGKEYHDGLDIATHCGDKVRAAHDGVVLYAGRNFDVYLGYRGQPEQIYTRLERLGRVNSLPIVVVVDDGNGYRSIYVHLGKANVEAGATVHAGDAIGREGMTGFATGCHLHYTVIRTDGGWQEVVPRLARFGYPALVRERINPLRILDWNDPDAPLRLQQVSTSPSPSSVPTGAP